MMTVQLLRANGCRVLGLDFDPDKLAMAAIRCWWWICRPVRSGGSGAFSRGRGVDA